MQPSRYPGSHLHSLLTRGQRRPVNKKIGVGCMRAWGDGSKTVFFGMSWVVSLLFTAQMAVAAPSSNKHGVRHSSSGQTQTAVKSSSGRLVSSHLASGNRYATHSGERYATLSGDWRATRFSAGHAVFPAGNFSRHALNGRGSYRYASHGIYRGYRGPTLQCVAYARTASSISLSGNAADWWSNAAGSYARGNRPQAGSVLAFSANTRMRLGHVAVVSRVINGREIEVDHANWGGYRGAIARAVPVVDVSPNNDWTAVRVGLSNNGDFGSVYPTFGFIYDRADNGVRVASVSHPAPALALNPAPNDLRPAYGRQTFTIQGNSYDEVAEAPSDRPAFERPDSSLR